MIKQVCAFAALTAKDVEHSYGYVKQGAGITCPFCV